jgi:signal peptidase
MLRRAATDWADPSKELGAQSAHTHRRNRRKRIGNLVFTIAFSAFAIFWIVALRPHALGGPASYVMVRGASMNPTYHSGDLVIVHRAVSYHVGDIVAYKVPQGDVGAGLTVIHRIVGGSSTTGFVTKGDNNPVADDWHPTGADIEGLSWLVMPQMGGVFVFLHDPLPLASLAAAIAVAMVVYRQFDAVPSDRRRRQWRLRRRSENDQDSSLKSG